jgi:DNA-binding NarL/FixJ family response regulator
MRWGFRQIVETLASDIRVLADVSTASEALNWLAYNDADVAVVDIGLEGRSGLDLVERIRSEFPIVKVLLYSRYSAREFALRGFKRGAAGFVNKSQEPEEVIRAVRETAQYGTYLTAETAQILRLAAAGEPSELAHKTLSPREDEVFRALLRGESVTAIARTLSLSVKTISTHRTNILQKLDLQSTADLVRYGIEHGIEH